MMVLLNVPVKISFKYIQRCGFMIEYSLKRQNYRTRSHSPIRRDTCFDAHLFRRLLCLDHIMLYARSDDVTACFFCVNNIVLHCQEKTNVK